LKLTAIIVAGGSGTRMQSEIPKQFLNVSGTPLLMHTINNFFSFDKHIKLVVVLPETQISFWKELCSNHQFDILHEVVAGGETRFHSVKNGLSFAGPHELVMIHDGVRPFVSHTTIENCIRMAKSEGNAVPAISINESVRQIDEYGNYIVDRTKLKLIQTPQVFHSEILIRAYQESFDDRFTDDASVVESIGYKINLVEGNPENIKITTRLDLMMASLLVQ
jgi:2-C-methyl-D-erythritol 4-phosphate cytidylyltransferase